MPDRARDKPTKLRLVEAMYPGDLARDVKAMIDLDMSWRRIADHISEKAKVSVSHETVRKWFGQPPAPNREAS